MFEDSAEATPAKKAAMLLCRVADGVLAANDALDQWPSPIKHANRLLTVGWTHLRHFADDADIHLRDPDYAQARVAELRTLAAKLHQSDTSVVD